MRQLIALILILIAFTTAGFAQENSTDSGQTSDGSTGSGSDDTTDSGSDDTGTGDQTGSETNQTDDSTGDSGQSSGSDADDSNQTDGSNQGPNQSDSTESGTVSPSLPPGCREVSDQNGFTRIECESRCPPGPSKDEVAQRCGSTGGTVDVIKDPMGCEFYTCKFSEKQNPFERYSKCQPPEEVDKILSTCKEQGLVPHMEKSGGCLVPACRPAGGFPGPQEFRTRSAEMKEQCAQYGGEYVEKADPEGKVVFAECIRRAYKSDVQVRPIENIPDSADLLQLAFKLESLRIEFDKLSSKSQGIADYYEGTGDTASAERFTKVAAMFSSAKGEVDKLKTKIAEKAKGEVTKKELLEIRHDVNYLKDVVMKNILFVMLGSDEQVTEARTEQCTEDECFEDAMILCEKGTQFSPEAGYTVTLNGVEDDRCIMHVEKGSKTMTCRIPDYSLGIRDPQTQVFPYCEGDLVADERGRSDFQGPGGCRGPEECEQYCRSNPQECMEFGRSQGFEVHEQFDYPAEVQGGFIEESFEAPHEFPNFERARTTGEFIRSVSNR